MEVHTHCYFYPYCMAKIPATLSLNPFAADLVNALQFAILVWPTIFNFLTFWHSGAQSWAPERPNVKKNKNNGLDQYGAESFEQQQCGTSGAEGVNGKAEVSLLHGYVIGHWLDWPLRPYTCYLQSTKSVRLRPVSQSVKYLNTQSI